MSTHELIFLHGCRTACCEAVVDKHFIGYCTLQYCGEGAVELFYDQQRHVAGAGAFWAAWPGPHIRFHALAKGQSWDHRYIAFTGPLVRRWESEGLLPRQPVTPVSGSDAQYWAREMDAVIANGLTPGYYSRLRAVNRLENILYSLAEANTWDAQDSPWLKTVLAELEKAGFFPDYRGVARRLHTGERTLRRRFQKLMGIPLHEHTIQHRLQAACQLLRRTDLTISEIAAQLGYRDIYFFSRQFQRKMKLSPTRFRASRQ